MTRATSSPLYAAKELLETRYEGAKMLFVAGSVIRGEASTYSDLDLVVIYEKIPHARRESFYHRDWPVEAFVHDPQTLRYFFQKVDKALGRPTLAEMISEGHEIPGPTRFSADLKAMAKQVLTEGPAAVTGADLEQRRYEISELLDDIREPKSRGELIAVATLIYNDIAEYFFCVKRSWHGRGKSVFKRMKSVDPVFARRFAEAFDLLFATGEVNRVIELAEDLLAPAGGVLFEGYRRDVPETWRIV